MSQATSGMNCWGQGFAPDALANLNSITSSQCSSWTLSVAVDGNNHISTGGYAYDLAGNMSQDGSGLSYVFDAENRLVQASGMVGGPFCYIYDGNALRVAKKSNATNCSLGTVTKIYWRSVSGEVIAETDSTGSTTNASYNEYVFFAGRRIAWRTGTGSLYYYHVDHLGTTRTITQSDGVPCYDAEFTPYGQEMLHTNGCQQNYKFTGYERDPETGLDYAVFRYYSSRLGRFLSPDPIPGSISDPQSLNAYTYVVNNPLALVDPMGLNGMSCRLALSCPSRTNGDGGDADLSGCTLDGVATPCGFVSSLLRSGGLQACLDAACTQKADISLVMNGSGSFHLASIQLGFATYDSPCPNGDCRKNPYPVEVHLEIPFIVFIPQVDAPGPGGITTGRAGLRPRTDKEYAACMNRAKTKRHHAILVARAEQVGGGLMVLGGVATVWVAWPAITATISEGFAAEPAYAAVDLPHMLMAYPITGSAVLIPGFLYMKGIFDQIEAYDNYSQETLNCVGLVPVN